MMIQILQVHDASVLPLPSSHSRERIFGSAAATAKLDLTVVELVASLSSLRERPRLCQTIHVPTFHDCTD